MINCGRMWCATMTYSGSRRILVPACVLLLLASNATPRSESQVHFVENCGQWGDHIRFAQLGPSAPLSIGPEGLSLIWGRRLSEDELEAVHVRFAFEGGRRDFRITPLAERSSRFSFFLGQDPDDWQRRLPGHERLRLTGIWPGVEIELLERDGSLAYDVHVGPGGDLGDVVFRCDGAERLWVDREGSLVIDTALGPIRQSAPRSWLVGPDGETAAVASEFRLLGNQRFGFRAALDELPPGWKLIVDPGLEWSTLIGTFGMDWVRDVGIDGAGAAYVSGWAGDRRYPTTPGAFSTTFRSGECFVTKFDEAGSSLIYSTFLGGSSRDESWAIEVLDDGTVLIGGSTLSTDFPVTSTAFQKSLSGSGVSDAFVSVLNPAGTQLLYSTYLGGAFGQDSVQAICFHDPVIAIGGYTQAPDFPVTSNGWDRTYNDVGFYVGDGFFGAIDTRSGSLVYSSFIGGASTDGVFDVGIANGNEIVLAGVTQSPDFPTTRGAFDESYHGNLDAFVARFDLASGRVIYSTLLGGTGNGSQANALAVIDTGEVIVGGWTAAPDFPVTAGSYDTQHGGGSWLLTDAFLIKLDASGSQIVWGTFLGGSGDDRIQDVELDPRGDIVLTGYTWSSDFPQIGRISDYIGLDAFVSRVDSTGSSLMFSTLLASSGADEGLALRVDRDGIVTAAGATTGKDFPTTEGAYDRKYDLMRDVFVTRLRTGPVLSLSGVPSSGAVVHFELEGGSPSQTGHLVQIALSGSGTSGIPLPGGESLPLTFDTLTSWSLALPSFFQGTMDAAGDALLATFATPVLPTGTKVFAAALVWDGTSGAISSVPWPLEFVVQ